MAEYIVDTSKIEHVPQISKETAYTMLFGECGVPLYERIVRCRDCKHYKCRLMDELWTGAEETPDGFCAWGEPKDGS